jgi:hypothetical protein
MPHLTFTHVNQAPDYNSYYDNYDFDDNDNVNVTCRTKNVVLGCFCKIAKSDY